MEAINMRHTLTILFLLLSAITQAAVTNYKSGIDVTWSGTDGTDYMEEYFYHNKIVDDHKVVYIKAGTNITMSHNANNWAQYHSAQGGNQIIGINGRDGTPASGDEGVIRYKIDRDRQYYWKWSDNYAGTETAKVLPAYSAPFSLSGLTYDGSTAVVGTTGDNGGSSASQSAYYYRGIIDPFGDEWHTLAYADDDKGFLDNRNTGYTTQSFVDQKFWASDGKTVLLVVNPKTPCLAISVTGTGKFYTTPPKAYHTPKVVEQTSYIETGSSGTVSIALKDINGNNVFWRIGGGSFNNAGSSTKVLTDSDFSTGTNTLEYYYDGNAAYTKTRTVVKNPTHPSLAESHGNYLFVDASNFSAIQSRITRAPYYNTYNLLRVNADNSGQSYWGSYGYQGKRYNGGATQMGNGHPNSYALKNAFVAKIEGWSYTRSGAAMSHGLYAIQMMLDQPSVIDPIGWELQPSSDSMPSRDINFIGYYDCIAPNEAIFAYDIIAANFRSDQVSGGLTPIDDYFVRDIFAREAYKAMMWSSDQLGGGSLAPGMWGSAHYFKATSIAMIMPEYSSPVYGTSGFGSVQTTYVKCPYETDQYTWKQALFDETATVGVYPNYRWKLPFSNNDDAGVINVSADSLFLKSGITNFKEGDWWARDGYFASGTFGQHMQIWSNMAKLWGSGKTNARLELAIQYATAGTLDSYYDKIRANYAGPFRHGMLLNLNTRWPTAAANNTAWVQSLASNNSNSDDKLMQDAGVFGFAWYDDTYYGGEAPDPPSSNVQQAEWRRKNSIRLVAH